MTLDTFFEKFELLADAPDAVGRMRELVLALAVQGKLVPQDPNDESAHQLFERISRQKKRLVSERAIRQVDTDAVRDGEAPFTIPESWVWVRLGDVGDWGSGSTPARGNHELYGGGVTWLKSGELNDNQALVGSAETVTEQALSSGSFRRNQPGDVLIAMYGATIGKVAILAEPAVTNQAVCGCTPFEGVTNRYLFNFLLSQRARFHAASEGGAQPNISKVKIVAFPIPLPPLAEQKRIVAKVEELMALCDRLEAQQQERATRHAALARASLACFAEAPTPAHLNLLFHPSYDIPPAELRKAILTLAVQGKLVAQDASEGATTSVTMEELVGRKNLKNGLSLSPTPSAPDFVCLPLSAITGSTVDCSAGKPIAITDERAAPYLIKPGDVFIMRGNGSKERVGVAAMARETPPNVLFPDLLIRVPLPTEKIDGDYFLIAWNNPLTRRTVETLAATTAGIWKINQGHISECSIPLPPLPEQSRIVAKVNQLMTLVDRVEARVAVSRESAEKLLEAVVTELTAENHSK